MSDISENEVIEENFEEVPLTKQKKPRSQAQVEAFEKVKEKRRQNLESKKQEKLLKSAKLLIEEENKKLLEPTVPVPYFSAKNPVEQKSILVKPPSRQSKKYAEPEPESESESEEEVIVVRKARRNPKPKKQKKVRKIIIEQSSSEEEDKDEESKQGYYQSSKRYHSIPQIIRPNPNDIFC
jgi:hypothetical protein